MANAVGIILHSRYILDYESYRVLSVDENFYKITGYDKSDVQKGLTQKELIFPEDWEEYISTVMKGRSGEGFLYLEHCIKKKDGSSIIVFCMGYDYENSITGKRETSVIITDVTESNAIKVVRNHDKKMEELASRDGLTGLYNRGHFERIVKQKLEDDNETQCALVMFDVDEFKQFNDKHGHNAGDMIMKIFAGKLNEYRNKHNSKTMLFARMGGDEFAVFLGDIKSVERLKMFDKELHTMLTDIKLPTGVAYSCTVSVGISIEEKVKTSFAELYKKAEQALFDAKQTGKNNTKIFQEEQTHFKRMKKSLLIVDDDENVRKTLSAMFEGECDILEASDGIQAVNIIRKKRDDIAAMLIDYDIPGMDGLAVLAYMRKNNFLKTIPVILIADENNVEICKTCYANGVSDVILKPFEPFLVRSRVNNTMDLYYHKNNLEILVQEQTERINEQNLRTINTLGTVVEFRNMESGTHIMRVREFTRLLLKQVAVDCPEYGLDSARIKMIAEASPLHDVGKIAISDTILLKPGRLTAEEFEVMKTHTTKGYDIVKHMTDMDDPEYMNCCAEIARSHHEKYDGKGYPDGLKGDDIPISAQIVSVADVYDALISERCYKKAYVKSVAFDMILNGECGAYNPKIMKSFKKLKDEFETLADKLQ